jgi:hypothetical protein
MTTMKEEEKPVAKPELKKDIGLGIGGMVGAGS